MALPGRLGEHGSMMLSISVLFTDVLLEVLPGREREFCNFVVKVIWASGGGADVGMQGVVAVKCRCQPCVCVVTVLGEVLMCRVKECVKSKLRV